MMHYVLTGASGHIGNNLVRYINRTQADATVTALTRRPVDRELAGAVCVQEIGNLLDEAYLRRHITADCVVVHLACLIDLSDSRWEETYRVNVETTQLLCDVCREVGCRFIYVGSVDAIPRTGREAAITEPLTYDPDRVEGHYGKSKAIATQYVLDAMATDPSFSAAVVLPSAVIGPHDYKPSAVGKVIRDTLLGKPAFGIKGGYNFVYVEDVCRAIVTLAKGNRRGQYIVSGEDMTVDELYGAVFRVMGVHRKPLMIPFLLVKWCMPFVPVLNPITLKSLREPHHYCCQKAKTELGYSLTCLHEAVKLTVVWFRSNLTN